MGFFDDLVKKAKKAKEQLEEIAYDKIGEVTGKDPEELRKEVEYKTKEIFDTVTDASKKAGDSISQQFGYETFDDLRKDKLDQYIEPIMGPMGDRFGFSADEIKVGQLPEGYETLESFDKQTFMFKTTKDLKKTVNGYAKEKGYTGKGGVIIAVPKKDSMVKNEEGMEVEVEFYSLPEKEGND